VRVQENEELIVTKWKEQGSEKMIELKDKRARKREIKGISEREMKHLKYKNDDEREGGKI